MHLVVRREWCRGNASPFKEFNGDVRAKTLRRRVFQDDNEGHTINVLYVNCILGDLEGGTHRVVVMRRAKATWVVLFRPTRFLPIQAVHGRELRITSRHFLCRPINVVRSTIKTFRNKCFEDQIVGGTQLCLLSRQGARKVLLPFRRDAFRLGVPRTVMKRAEVPDFRSLPFRDVFVVVLSTNLALVTDSLIHRKFKCGRNCFLPFLSASNGFKRPNRILSRVRRGNEQIRHPFN